MPESEISAVVPAQLSFLAIYNPRLGPADETLHDQVVFYTSRASRLRRIESSAADKNDDESKDESNKKLRQIGLAQGMVNFARDFSEGKTVDYVETEQSRVVIYELEKDWWILASIDLTRLPSDPSSNTFSQRDASDTPSFHYSSREMSPPHLLIQQLRCAHSIFLLHHEFSLGDLFQRVGRPTFCSLLGRFWERFAWNWDVLLSGNPAVDIFNGIKLSAGGELGIGVGEEEWGSGEREVLEDFVVRTEGLMDIVVSRFGDPRTDIEASAQPKKSSGDCSNQGGDTNWWLGSDNHPQPSDGVIFSGVGNISRSSLVQISQWMEWIYRYGDDAYGVRKDPTSPRRRRYGRNRQRGRLPPQNNSTSSAPINSSKSPAAPDRSFSPGIPRPLVMGTSQPPLQTSDDKTSSESSPTRSDRGSDWSGFGTDTFVKYLTLGYGSSWGLSSGSPSPHPRVAALKEGEAPSDAVKQNGLPADADKTNKENSSKNKEDTKPKATDTGRFIIGLRDDMDNPKDEPLEDNGSANQSQGKTKDTVVRRTLHVRLAAPPEGSTTGTTKLQAVVYARQPFMFTFLFDTETPSLADHSLYHTIHHQLGPLQKPLSNSTSPATAAARISQSDHTFDSNKRFSIKNEPVHDLVYDPSNLTIRSSIPNIPDLGPNPTDPLSHRDPNTNPLPWSRIDSLNIHHRLLSTYLETRSRPLELERTCKTSRGWWIVWVRMSPPTDKEEGDNNTNPSPNNPTEDAVSSSDDNNNTTITAPQEAFLIRRASDHASSMGHARGNSGSRFLRDLGGAASPRLQASRADLAPGKLVEGLSLDARRYIEGLLRLNR